MRDLFKLSLSVFMFLEKDGQILLLKRSNTGWMDGYFSVPAGALDGDEPLDQAVVRETDEEVAVTVEPENLKMVHTIHCKTEGNEWIGVFFTTKKWEGSPQVNEPEKHGEVRWQAINDLPENTIPYVRQALEKYKQNIPFSTYGW